MEVMKNLSRHIQRWNYWRKRNVNGRLHHILVLLGVVKSPTFAFTLLPEEIYILDDQIHDVFIFPCEECDKEKHTYFERRQSL